jgi:protein-S-isoprenylcysteine O-methyltransferase Ste14
MTSSKKLLLWQLVLLAALLAVSRRYNFHALAHRAIGVFPFLAPDRALLAHRPLYMAAIVIWALFSIYWEIAARNSSQARQSETRGSRVTHILLANFALGLEIVPFRALGRFVPANEAVMAAGIALEVAGLLMAIWARGVLGSHWSGEITIKVDHELVRSGPYRRLRHPIYTGLLAMYVGQAIVTGEWLAVAGLAMAFYAYWRKIRLEEANLVVAFGADYDAYRSATWALVPGIF